jgi:hypothetical protein
MVVSSHHDAVVVIGVNVPAQGQLLFVSLTTCASGQFLCLGQGWQQQGGKDGDDRNDNQQLNQGKPQRGLVQRRRVFNFVAWLAWHLHAHPFNSCPGETKQYVRASFWPRYNHFIHGQAGGLALGQADY